MANIINIESRQHKKEHFVYVGDSKIAVFPLGPDMSKYDHIQNVTIYALRGWYYISHEDKAKVEAITTTTKQEEIDDISNPSPLEPREPLPGF